MVGAIRFLLLALVAKTYASVGCLYGEGSILHAPALRCWQVTVAIIEVQRRAWIGEYGGRVAPIKHKIEEDAKRGRKLALEKVSIVCAWDRCSRRWRCVAVAWG